MLVRHGETEWSRSGQHTSRTDLPLLATGEAQARAVGAALVGRRFALVLTSPLRRAVQTCEVAGFGEQAHKTPDLVEWDYGDYEGRTSKEICQEAPGWTLWSEGVKGGESAGEVGRRADRVIERCAAAGGDTLCFAHGHLLRVLAARWLGLPAVAGRLLTLSPGSISELGWERSSAVIVHWNEIP